MNKENLSEQVSRKLNVLISLVQDLKYREFKSSLREKIAYFDRFDLKNKDIANILNISEKHVSKEKSLMKKKNG